MTKVKDAHYYGVVITGDTACDSPVRMPCGYVVAPPEEGWPILMGDIPCPCGRKEHTLFRRQLSAML